ncbi:MAG: prepilin peptidase [Desulfobacteraceae bacterium]|nr:prepilin peptidase [Desulfobacteraceae bacterium]
MIDYLIEITAFLFGLIVGSFLNVCIYRIPVSQSIVFPGSTCPRCKTSIPFYDNIPVLSWIALGGKCRNCRAAISARYPLVELLGGCAALSTVMVYGINYDTLIYFIFITALLTITFIDIDHRIIPDSISLPGIPLGFLASFILADLTYRESLLGILVGGGSLLVVAYGYQLLTGRAGMGGGDIKLLGMIGAFIGWKGVLFTIFASSALGTLAGIVAMIRTRKGMKLAVPFGPFLSIAAVLYLFFGTDIIDWYFNFLK